MAVQISCTILINGDRYALIGLTGSDLRTSKQFGSSPIELPVAYHGGFYATYEITPVGLYLRALNRENENGDRRTIGENSQAKDINPAMCCEEDVFVPFTGRVRLAKDFINQPRVNVAYQKALAFKTVFDITLKEGQIVDVKDRSWEMEQKREAIKNCSRFPDKLERVLDAFSLDLELE